MRLKLKIPFKISLYYLIFGLVWIFFTDYLAQRIFPYSEEYFAVQNIKGVVYVLISSLFILHIVGVYIRNMQRKQEKILINEQKIAELHEFESIGLISSQFAHDIRNQITIIDSLFQLNFKSENNFCFNQNEIEDITQSMQNIKNLLNQMRYIGKKYHPIRSSIDLNQFIVKETSKYIRILDNKIKVIFELCPELPEIYASPTDLSQILTNLIRNSSESLMIENPLDQDKNAMEKAITIRTGFLTNEQRTIRLKIPEMEIIPENKYIFFEIEDNGAGIKPKDLKNLFNPYYTTKEMNSGTGLGLYTIYTIVSNNDAQICIISPNIKGICLQIIWPIIKT